MIKKLLVVAVALIASGSLFAKTEGNMDFTPKTENNSNECKIESDNYRDNWFVNVAAGPQILFSDHDRQNSFGNRIAPALDIAVGKWFKPGIGVRLMYSGLKAKGATQSGIYSTGKVLGGAEKGWTDEQEFSFCNVHADIIFNVSKLFNHYSLSKVWNCNPYMGVGFAHVYDSPTNNCASFNIGIYNVIHIVQALDATVDLRGAVMGDTFDGEKGHRKGDGILTLSLGLSYNF